MSDNTTPSMTLVLTPEDRADLIELLERSTESSRIMAESAVAAAEGKRFDLGGRREERIRHYRRMSEVYNRLHIQLTT